jgi:hypothetical protein
MSALCHKRTNAAQHLVYMKASTWRKFYADVRREHQYRIMASTCLRTALTHNHQHARPARPAARVPRGATPLARPPRLFYPAGPPRIVERLWPV